MFKYFVFPIVGVALLSFSVHALAVDKNPCPPIVPKTGMTYMKKVQAAMALTSDAAKRAAIKKLQDTYSRDITKPETWSGCHTIRDTLTIDAPVTVSAGSVLKFKANAGLQIGSDGSLNATGTADKPITFTATDKTPGYWYGLFFASRSAQNRLIHAKVLYAGGVKVGRGVTLSRPGGDNDPPSYAVLVKKGALLTMQHSVIAYSGGYGLQSLGQLGEFTDNRIEHTQIPLRLRLDNVRHVVSSNKFTDNKKQQIDVIGNATLTRDATWQDLGVPYNMRYLITIASNLKLEPGVVLKMGEGAALAVRSEGSFNAVGTESKPIVIEGWQDVPGYWSDLQFSGRSAKNVLSHVKVADGGGAGTDPYHGTVQVGNHAKLSVTHSVISKSKGYGLVIDGALGDFSDNRIEHNAAPMRMQVNAVGQVDASNRFEDNDKQQIFLVGAPGISLKQNATWQDLGVPYSMRYGVDIHAYLILEPGVELLMGEGADIDVDSGASLKAIGSSDKPITIRGASKRAGYWNGIKISSHDRKNMFRHVTVADAGADSPNYAIIEDYGYLDIARSRIENGKKVGIWVANYPSPNAVLKASGNTFKNVEVKIQKAK